MGMVDRDYQRDGRRGGGGFLSQLTPVIKWLLILNGGIYFLDLALKGHAMDGPLRLYGAFTVEAALGDGEVWRFITFQFLHGDFAHILFNSLGIFFFGPWLERWWGSLKFTIFYLLCGTAGAAFFSLLLFLGFLPEDSSITPLVGASAGIYGILMGVAFIAPNLRVALLFPPVELSMRQMAMTLLALSTGLIFLGYAGINLLGLGGNEGGEAGHLGGAIFGFLLMKFPFFLGGGDNAVPTRLRLRKPQPLAKLRPRSGIENEQDTALDKILDKISSDGFQSLTQEEKDLLHKISNQKKSTR